MQTLTLWLSYNTQPNTGLHKLVASLSFNYACGLLGSSPIHLSLPVSTPPLFLGTFKLPPAHYSFDKAVISPWRRWQTGERERAGEGWQNKQARVLICQQQKLANCSPDCDTGRERTNTQILPLTSPSPFEPPTPRLANRRDEREGERVSRWIFTALQNHYWQLAFVREDSSCL